MVFDKNVFFAKKGACGKPPAEENCPFPRETLFLAKKGACGKPPARGKNVGRFFVFFLSRTWGIILAIIACLFELVDDL